MPTTTSILAGIFSDTKLILSTHTRHFLALSTLFLLPLSSLLLSLPLFISLSPPSPLPHPPQSLLRSPPYFLSPHPHPLSLLLILLILILSLSASSSLSLSSSNSFFSRPVNLLPSLSSLPPSLLRLLLTLSLPLLLLSPLPLLLPLPLFALAFVLIFILFSSTSSLIFPIAILERSWGTLPFHRSNHLLNRMRLKSLCINLFFLVGLGLVLWGFSVREIGRLDVGVVAMTVVGMGAVVLLMLYWIVSVVVLYMYCKAVNGELAWEIAEEVAGEYVCLPFDENKVPHIVSVVRQ